MTGRGPTSDMSPLRTFQSWGSSSRLHVRRNRPTRVTRSSTASLNRPPFSAWAALSALDGASVISVRTYSRCGARAHRPEFQDIERHHAPTEPLLPEDRGAGGIESHRNGDDRQHGGEKDQQQSGSGDVEA